MKNELNDFVISLEHFNNDKNNNQEAILKCSILKALITVNYGTFDTKSISKLIKEIDKIELQDLKEYHFSYLGKDYYFLLDCKEKCFIYSFYNFAYKKDVEEARKTKTNKHPCLIYI